MIEILVECRKTSCEKIAKLLLNFLDDHKREFKIWVQEGNVRAYFKVPTEVDFESFVKKLKTRKIGFSFLSIKKVISHEKR